MPCYKTNSPPIHDQSLLKRMSPHNQFPSIDASCLTATKNDEGISHRGGRGGAGVRWRAQTARVTRRRYATGSPGRRRCAQRRHARHPAAAAPRQAWQGTPGDGGAGGRRERIASPSRRVPDP